MLAFLLTLALLVPATAQDGKGAPAPDQKLVDATVDALGRALRSSEFNERVSAIREASQIIHADVIKAIAKGLKDKRNEVKAATIEALRFMDHPDALETLHRTYKKDKKVTKDELLFIALLRAIGQHKSKSSIDILADNPFKGRARRAIQARILGLGHIRDRRSVEELVAMLQKVGKEKTRPHRDDFRLAMIVLTGTDEGTSGEAWTRWWNKNKKTFTVAEKAPVLPERLQYNWDRYWGYYHVKGRGEKREDRGDDPDDD